MKMLCFALLLVLPACAWSADCDHLTCFMQVQEIDVVTQAAQDQDRERYIQERADDEDCGPWALRFCSEGPEHHERNESQAEDNAQDQHGDAGQPERDNGLFGTGDVHGFPRFPG